MKKINRKKEIVEVATDLFLKNGFDRTSVEEITNAAGIAKGSFYTYFSSKEELLNEIVSSTISAIEKEISLKVKKNANPTDAIAEFLKMNASLSRKYVPGILITLKEVKFSAIAEEKGPGAKITEKIRGLLKRFIVSLKGKCEEEDLLLMWGITLSLWIEVGLEGHSPDFDKLACKIWFGLGGDKT